MVSNSISSMVPDREISFDDVSIFIVDDPSKFFLKAHMKTESDKVISQIDSVVTSGFGHELGDGIDGTRSHVVDASMVSIAVCDDKIVGFASCKLYPLTDHRIFYLHGVAVDREHKGKKIGTRLISSLLDSSGMDHIALTTQNPIMYCLVEKLSENLFPAMKSVVDPPGAFSNTAYTLLIAGNRPGFFDQSLFVVYDLYSECLYDSIPKSNRHEVNSFFAKRLDVDARNRTRNGLFLMGKLKQK
jgi:ribosomal protein S18 acetylase RimI-like enzyme